MEKTNFEEFKQCLIDTCPDWCSDDLRSWEEWEDPDDEYFNKQFSLLILSMFCE